ncbi:hypothetical protein IAT40_003121 [Kwoniella sp. CBS 6097]
MASLIALGVGAGVRAIKNARNKNSQSNENNDLSPESSMAHAAQLEQTQDKKSSKGPIGNSEIPIDAPPSYEQANSARGLAPGSSSLDRQVSSSSTSSSSSSDMELAKRNPGLSRAELKALKRSHRSECRLARDQRRSNRRADKAQYRADKRALKAEQDAEIAKLAAAARQKGETMKLDPLYLPREYAYRGFANCGGFNTGGGGGSM